MISLLQPRSPSGRETLLGKEGRNRNVIVDVVDSTTLGSHHNCDPSVLVEDFLDEDEEMKCKKMSRSASFQDTTNVVRNNVAFDDDCSNNSNNTMNGREGDSLLHGGAFIFAGKVHNFHSADNYDYFDNYDHNYDLFDEGCDSYDDMDIISSSHDLDKYGVLETDFLEYERDIEGQSYFRKYGFLHPYTIGKLYQNPMKVIRNRDFLAVFIPYVCSLILIGIVFGIMLICYKDHFASKDVVDCTTNNSNDVVPGGTALLLFTTSDNNANININKNVTTTGVVNGASIVGGTSGATSSTTGSNLSTGSNLCTPKKTDQKVAEDGSLLSSISGMISNVITGVGSSMYDKVTFVVSGTSASKRKPGEDLSEGYSDKKSDEQNYNSLFYSFCNAFDEHLGSLKEKASENSYHIRNKVHDISRHLGTKITDLGSSVGSSVTSTVGPKFSELSSTVAPKLSGLSDLVGPKLSEMSDVVGPKLSTLGGTIGSNVYDLKEGFLTRVSGLISSNASGTFNSPSAHSTSSTSLTTENIVKGFVSAAPLKESLKEVSNPDIPTSDEEHSATSKRYQAELDGHGEDSPHLPEVEKKAHNISVIEDHLDATKNGDQHPMDATQAQLEVYQDRADDEHQADHSLGEMLQTT